MTRDGVVDVDVIRRARATTTSRSLGDVGEQRDRHDPADRRAGASARRRAARSSTPTPCRRSARSRSTRRRCRSTFSRSPATRSARPRESARCSSVAARASSRCFTAARRIAASPGHGERRRGRRLRARGGAGAWRSARRSARGSSALRDRLEAGDPRAHSRRRHSRARRAQRAPHIVNVSVPGTDSESMLMALDLRGIGCSAGSACQSGSIDAVARAEAIGVAPDLASAAIRMSLGCSDDGRVHRSRRRGLPRPRRQGARHARAARAS